MAEKRTYPYPYPRRFKEEERDFYAGIRALAKGNGWRFTQFYVWRAEGPFLVSAAMLLRRNVFGFEVDGCVKTLEEDDVYWDVVGMPGNKERPTSLHATAAFCADGLRIGMPEFPFPLRGEVGSEDEIVLGAWEAFLGFAADAHAYLDSIGRDPDRYYDDLYRDNEARGSDGRWDMALALACKGDYEGAVSICRGSIDSYDKDSPKYEAVRKNMGLIVTYCERRLAGEGD